MTMLAATPHRHTHTLTHTNTKSQKNILQPRVWAKYAKHNHKLEPKKEPKFRLNLFILINYLPFIWVFESSKRTKNTTNNFVWGLHNILWWNFSLLSLFLSISVCSCNFFSLIQKYFSFLHYPNSISRQFFKASHYQCNFPAFFLHSHFLLIKNTFCDRHFLLSFFSFYSIH